MVDSASCLDWQSRPHTSCTQSHLHTRSQYYIVSFPYKYTVSISEIQFQSHKYIISIQKYRVSISKTASIPKIYKFDTNFPDSRNIDSQSQKGFRSQKYSFDRSNIIPGNSKSTKNRNLPMKARSHFELKQFTRVSNVKIRVITGFFIRGRERPYREFLLHFCFFS